MTRAAARLALGCVLMLALTGCPPTFSQPLMITYVAPADLPILISTNAVNLAHSPDGAFVFAGGPSARAGRALFLHLDPATPMELVDPTTASVVGVEGAPVPEALFFWPSGHGHGYIALDLSTYGNWRTDGNQPVIGTLASVDLDRRERRWLRHIDHAAGASFGVTAGGERIWVSRPEDGAIELYRSDDGARVATIAVPSSSPLLPMVIAGDDERLVVGTQDLLSTYDARDGQQRCSTATRLLSGDAVWLAGDRIVVGRSLAHPHPLNIGSTSRETAIFDAHDCTLADVLPGPLYGVFGDRVVWWIDALYPTASAGQLPALTATGTRWYLAVTTLSAPATIAVPIAYTNHVAISTDGKYAVVQDGSPARHIIDLTTGSIAPLVEPPMGYPMQAGIATVSFASDAAVAYLSFAESAGLWRADLAAAAVAPAELRLSAAAVALASPARRDESVRAIPGVPWLVVDLGDRIAIVDRDSLGVQLQLTTPPPRAVAAPP